MITWRCPSPEPFCGAQGVSRKMMCARRKGVFRPRLTLEQTGYSGSGWQWVVWFLGGSGRLVNGGGPLVSDASPREALVQYFDLGTIYLTPLTLGSKI
jgi:hypothetical protein